MIDDVPSPIDLRKMSDAVEWERSAMLKRPSRTEFFERFAAEIDAAPKKIYRVLELGSGPGFLAKHLLGSLSDISCVLLDFSPAMHEIAKSRLSGFEERYLLIERSLKDKNWPEGLGRFDCVVTNQTVHELRHNRHATGLHYQVRGILNSGGIYLVCDHFVGPVGMHNDRLYMSIDEQRQSLLAACSNRADLVLFKDGLAMHRAG